MSTFDVLSATVRPVTFDPEDTAAVRASAATAVQIAAVAPPVKVVSASTVHPTTTTTRPRATTTTTTRSASSSSSSSSSTSSSSSSSTTSSGSSSSSSSHSETGPASWYQAPAGTCAHPWLPFGTVVHVTNLANGATTTCTVEDRGPYEGGRIIDLSEQTFSQIASPSQGVIQVRINW